MGRVDEDSGYWKKAAIRTLLLAKTRLALSDEKNTKKQKKMGKQIWLVGTKNNDEHSERKAFKSMTLHIVFKGNVQGTILKGT